MKATGVSGCTLVYPDGLTIEEGEERVVILISHKTLTKKRYKTAYILEVF